MKSTSKLENAKRVEDRYRGVTTSLALVAIASLLVAFGAAARRHNSQGELAVLKSQIEQLSEENASLTSRLQWVEGRFEKARSQRKELNLALLKAKAVASSIKSTKSRVERTPVEEVPAVWDYETQDLSNVERRRLELRRQLEQSTQAQP